MIYVNSNSKHTKNNKKEDGKFGSKNINHNPQAESARAVSGFNQDKMDTKK